MKRLITMILALLLILSLTGCGNRGQASQQGATDPSHSHGTAATKDPGNVITTCPLQDSVLLGQTGKIRIPYKVNVSFVQYITAADQLPDYEELAGYDDAYFREKALLLVFETVSSGTIQVDIDSVTLEDGNAIVKLSHTASGIGTGDMSVWMLWAEVQQGLTCKWSVANPAIGSDASEY